MTLDLAAVKSKKESEKNINNIIKNLKNKRLVFMLLSLITLPASYFLNIPALYMLAGFFSGIFVAFSQINTLAEQIIKEKTNG